MHILGMVIPGGVIILFIGWIIVKLAGMSDSKEAQDIARPFQATLDRCDSGLGLGFWLICGLILCLFIWVIFNALGIK